MTWAGAPRVARYLRKPTEPPTMRVPEDI
jgi:hypothetical protein